MMIYQGGQTYWYKFTWSIKERDLFSIIVGTEHELADLSATPTMRSTNAMTALKFGENRLRTELWPSLWRRA